MEVIIGINHLDNPLKALHYSLIDSSNIFVHNSDYYIKSNSYNPNITEYYDLALLRLVTPAVGIPTLSLKNTFWSSLAGENAVVRGFGLDTIDLSVTPDPKFSGYSMDIKSLPIFLVAYDSSTSKNSHIGDSKTFGWISPSNSGEVLVYESGDKASIIEVTSDIIPRTTQAHFTAIYPFLSWIREKTGIFPDQGTYNIPSDLSQVTWRKSPIATYSGITDKIKCYEKSKICMWVLTRGVTPEHCTNDVGRLPTY